MGKSWLPVGPSIFLLLLFLLPGNTSPSTTEPQYLVLVPFLIHTETPEKLCVHLTQLNESVTLTTTLEYEGQNKSLINNVVSDKDFFQCSIFTLPKWTGFPEVLLTVEVKGATLRFWSRKRVLVKNLESLVFIQTDKPLYKPGQTVQFRIVSLNEDFFPLNEKFPLVYIKDPKRNRLFQWHDVELQRGLVQLSFPLSYEPPQGTYTVVAQRASGSEIAQAFTVEEYVLPKFNVLMKVPKVITILDNNFKVTVCGVYTYGKPVPGQVNIQVCRQYSFHRTSSCYGKESEAVCEEFSGELDAKGCFSEVVNTKLFQLKQSGYASTIKIEGKITEEGTEVELKGTGTIQITSTISKLTFEAMPSFYKPGIPYSGKVTLVDGSDVPIANKTIQIHVGKLKWNYTTNDHGQVKFSIDTANFTHHLNVEASYNNDPPCYSTGQWSAPQHQRAYHSAVTFYSPTKSFVHIDPPSGTWSCGQKYLVQVHYIVNPEVVKEKDMVFHYLVLAKGGIVQAGSETVALEHKKGFFSLLLSADVDIAPLARLLLYAILPNGEVIAHSEDFAVENCFSNKVKLQFPTNKSLPASKTHLHLSASKDSLCAIHAVDKSVLGLKSEAELSPQTVYNLLPVKNINSYSYNHHYMEDPDVNPCIVKENIIVDGFLYSPVTIYSNKGDVYDIFKNLGLKAFTGTKIHMPNVCQPDLSHMGYGFHAPIGLAGPSIGLYRSSEQLHGAVAPIVQPTEIIRKYFPETWLWDLITVDSTGNADVPVTLPDTITEWKTGAFCTSEDTGFGLSEAISLQAFQPFFVELTLPYSVVRGEVFTLKGTAFTYLQHCIRVSLSLAPSPNFVASPVESEEDSYCLCANGRKTVSWNVTPKSLGKVNITVVAEALKSEQLCGNEVVETPREGQKDTVIKQLLVEPEGIEKEVVLSALLCAAEDVASAPISLKLPKQVVEDSARARFCVLGDILGSAIQNLHQLLKMPYGCGEQNMALFAPNIYILNYLNTTGQLTEETKSKAIGYLTAGYQRQLNYNHNDGSYSTFGSRYNNEGNTWLTAFVLKSFSQARRYIFVDEVYIRNAHIWLAAKQKANGCFRSSGTLLNNAVLGGVETEVTLSAYITIALLEISVPLTDSVVRNAMFCLETAAQEKELRTYTKALLAYAFALAGKEDKKKMLLDSLDKEAVKEDGSIHWQRPGSQDEANPLYYLPRAPSAEVEMTSYVLLAYLSKKPAPSQEELTTATSIVKWLSKQQNPNGGFSSTQDTVVALQALSLYGASTYFKSATGSKVTLKSGGDTLDQFHVDNNNRLLLQCAAVPQVPGDYQAEATGNGCVYVQTSLRYNVLPHQEDAPFALDVHTVPETCTTPKAHSKFGIAINVSYTGKRPVSNMAMVDIKMLSGFIPVKSSVKKLEGQSQVKRTEVSTNHVLLYLEQVSNVTQSLAITVEQEVPVQSLKPALVTVYDYYETDEFAVAQYSGPCSTVMEQASSTRWHTPKMATCSATG